MNQLSLMVLVSAGLGLVLCDTAAAQMRQSERMVGANENPPVATVARGNFTAQLLPDRIGYRLTYSGIESDVLQAHLHAGNPGSNGNIVVFLCTNLGNAQPPGATPPPCPPPPAVVEGDILAADVIGGATPGLDAGDLTGLRRLIAQGAVYANVHSGDNPTGEVRGQLQPRIR